MFFGLAVLWVVDGKIKKETVLHAIFAAFVAWMITEVIKLIFPSLRPFEADGLEISTLTIPTGGSFPSTHTAAGFALAATVYTHDKKVGALYFVMAALVGVARILANVHYPADIAVGAIVGLVSYVLTQRSHFFNFLKSRKA